MYKYWKEIIIIVIVLFISIFFLLTCERNPIEREIITKIDTVFVYKQGVIYTKPVLVKSISPNKEEVDTRFTPNKNYEELLKQYNSLAYKYLTKNIECDSILIDSLGYAKIIDTIKENSIQGRKFEYHLKIPEITKTIIMTPEKKREVYLGGELKGQNLQQINYIGASLLYKTKKDKFLGISAGLNNYNQVNYGVSYHFKLF